jgi:hypothetical protein
MTTEERTAHPLVNTLRLRSRVLADQAERLIEHTPRFMEYTLSTFSGGTDHTQRHTRTVERIACMVLSDEFLAALADEELFFLAVACHYHDLAMSGTEADDKTAESREQVRRDHAVRIGDIVREKWAELGFENRRLAVVLGEVCRGHRPKKNAEGEANWDELNAAEVLGPGVAVRVRLLSALIYAIDELHLGSDRAPERVQDWRNIQDDESRRHWRRHQAVHGPIQVPGPSLLLQASADTPKFEESLRSQVFLQAFSALRDLRWQADVEGVAVPIPSIGQPQAGSAFVAFDGSGGDLPQAEAVGQPQLQGIPVLAAKRGRQAGGPSLECGRYLCAVARRFHLPGGDHRLVQPVCAGVASVEHAGRVVVPGDVGGGVGAWKAGSVQHRSRSAVHGGGVDESVGTGGRVGEHGRSGSLSGQRVRGTAVAIGEVRGRLFAWLREGGGVGARAASVLPVLQQRAATPVFGIPDAGGGVWARPLTRYGFFLPTLPQP